MARQNLQRTLSTIGIAGTAGLLVFSLGPHLLAQGISDQQRLNIGGSNPSGSNAVHGINLAIDPTIDGGYVAVWADQYGTSELPKDIYLSRTDDWRISWSPMVRVDLGDSPNSTDSEFPKVRITASGVIVVTWLEQRDAAAVGSSEQDVFFNRSTDGGITWMPISQPLNVASAGPDAGSDVDRISMDSDGERIVVTWEEDTITGLWGDEEMWFTASDSGGSSWSTPIIVSTGMGQSDVDDPKVRLEGGTVHLAYVDSLAGVDQIYYRRSLDLGLHWSPPLALESDTSGSADEPQMEVQGGLICISWTDNEPAFPGGESIHAVVSSDGGQSWGPELYLDPLTDGLAGSDADVAQIDHTTSRTPLDGQAIRCISSLGEEQGEIKVPRARVKCAHQASVPRACPARLATAIAQAHEDASDRPQLLIHEAHPVTGGKCDRA